MRLDKKEQKCDYSVLPCLCSVDILYVWLLKFILEIQREGWQRVFPNPLYEVCCGILRYRCFRTYTP